MSSHSDDIDTQNNGNTNEKVKEIQIHENTSQILQQEVLGNEKENLSQKESVTDNNVKVETVTPQNIADTKVNDTVEIKSNKNKKSKPKYNYVQINNGKAEEGMQTFEQYKIKYYPSLNKDLPLKYFTKLLFKSMGYYCELEINIFTQSFNQKYKKEQISDIDVLGIRIENDLSIDFIPVECKSGEDGALDELLKLKGLMEYLNSHKGYLIKSKIANNAREMGEKINVSTIDQNEIRQLLNNIGLLNISDNKWVDTQLNNYLREKYICERAINFNRTLEYLRNEYWINKNFRNIHNIIFLSTSQKDSSVYSTDEGRYTLIQLCKHLSISLLILGSYIIHKNFSNPVDKVKEYMFGGAREKREREVLFDKVNQILAGYGKTSQKFESDYIEHITEVCIRLISSPNYAKEIPACFDYYLNAYILKNDGYEKDKIPNVFTSITLKLAKDILVFLCKQGNIKTNIFDDFLNI